MTSGFRSVVGIISAYNFPAAVWAQNGFSPPSAETYGRLETESQGPRHGTRPAAPLQHRHEGDGCRACSPCLSGGQRDRGTAAARSPRGARVLHRFEQCRPQGRQRRRKHAWPPLPCSNAPATMAALSMRRRISSSRPEASPSELSAPRGQRCTSTRRIIAQKSIAAPLVDLLKRSLRADQGRNPREEGAVVGPLIDKLPSSSSSADQAGRRGTRQGCIRRQADPRPRLLCGADHHHRGRPELGVRAA